MDAVERLDEYIHQFECRYGAVPECNPGSALPAAAFRDCSSRRWKYTQNAIQPRQETTVEREGSVGQNTASATLAAALAEYRSGLALIGSQQAELTRANASVIAGFPQIQLLDQFEPPQLHAQPLTGSRTALLSDDIACSMSSRRTGSASSGSPGGPTCGLSSPVSGRSSPCPDRSIHHVLSNNIPNEQSIGQHVKSLRVTTEPCVRSLPSSLGVEGPKQKVRLGLKPFTPMMSQQCLVDPADDHVQTSQTAMPAIHAMPSFWMEASGQERVPCSLHNGSCSTVEGHRGFHHHHKPPATWQTLWPKPVERVDRARKPRSPPSFRKVHGKAGTGTDDIEAYLQRLCLSSAPRMPTGHCQALGCSLPVMDNQGMSRELNHHLNVRPGAHIRVSPYTEAPVDLPRCSSRREPARSRSVPSAMRGRLESQAFGRGCSSLGSALAGVECTQHAP